MSINNAHLNYFLSTARAVAAMLVRPVVIATRSPTNTGTSSAMASGMEVISHGRRKGSVRATGPPSNSAMEQRPGLVRTLTFTILCVGFCVVLGL